MKSAIIGYGVIGAVHYQVLQELGVEIAVCDTDKEKLSALTGVKTYSDYKEMLRSFAPDVVHICTPHYLHAEMVVECLNQGKNVLCEKPLCIREEEIPLILQAEQNSTGILGVCHQNRYNAVNVFVKEYLQKEKPLSGFGSVVWKRTAEYYQSGKWRGKWETEGGGVLINQALHTLDLLIWFLGKPERVKASLANLSLPQIEVEDTATLVCSGGETASGFSFFATNASEENFGVEVTVKTDRQTLKVMPSAVVVGSELKTFDCDDRFYGKYCYGSGHGRLVNDFYDCIQTGRKFPVDGREGAKVVEVILSAYKKWKQGD